MLLQQRGNKHLGVEGAHHELNLGHCYGNCFELPLVMVHTLRPILIMKTYQWFQIFPTQILCGCLRTTSKISILRRFKQGLSTLCYFLYIIPKTCEWLPYPTQIPYIFQKQAIYPYILQRGYVWWFEALLMAIKIKKIYLGPKTLYFLPWPWYRS